MVKNCDFGLEMLPSAVFSRPRSQFFTTRTSQPANNIYLLMAEERNICFFRTLCTVTLESIFPILFSGHILGLWKGEFVQQSKHLRLVIISFIIMILMISSEVLLCEQSRCWSLLGFKGLVLCALFFFSFLFCFVLFLFSCYFNVASFLCFHFPVIKVSRALFFPVCLLFKYRTRLAFDSLLIVLR